jgi:hypothetical protein
MHRRPASLDCEVDHLARRKTVLGKAGEFVDDQRIAAVGHRLALG